MRKTVSLLTLAFFLACQTVASAGTTVDSLIEKLTEKGILTEKEATQLKGEIAFEEKNNIEEVSKKQIPDWVQNVKLSGDVRFRVQSERRNDQSLAALDHKDRVRPRLRARLNVESKINDKAKIVVGVSTDGGGARSTNVTFGGNVSSGAQSVPFSKTNIVLNKAYGTYSFTKDFTVTAGKMDNPLWEPMEFLWDADITPEGASVRYDYKVNDTLSVYGTGSVFSISELNPATHDPGMGVLQVGGTLKPNDKFDVKAAGSYYYYSNLKKVVSTNGRPGTVSATSFTNTPGTVANSYKYEFKAPVGALELGINNPFGENFPIYVPRLGFFGEYTKNPQPTDNNTAWMAGVYLGNSKVSGFGTWKWTGAYKVIGRDAWLDLLPDSDFYAGGTDIKGVESMIEIGLAKNMTFVFDYYAARRYSALAPKNPEHVFQADINWKF